MRNAHTVLSNAYPFIIEHKDNNNTRCLAMVPLEDVCAFKFSFSNRLFASVLRATNKLAYRFVCVNATKSTSSSSLSLSSSFFLEYSRTGWQ